jgi:uncharacterized integral membrane protein
MGIALIVVSAFVFYRIAVIEQLNPWQWAGASVLVSLGALAVGGLFTMALGQVVLFGVLWWFNSRHKTRRAEEEIERER